MRRPDPMYHDFTLIFEYGQPASNFAELSSWAKDWHKLEVKALDGREKFFTNSSNIFPF